MANLIKDIIWSLLPKKIYGLIGPAGSGKSFRAYLIAEKYNIEYIIDDGLLIKGQKIIAGKSAKKETLRVSAIKRAIFHETKHAREVRKTLYKERFTSLLIIGISESMLLKICNRLHIPKATKIIKIQDVATEEEIKEARFNRKKHGSHVIPIPLIEVKKKYPNIVLHAIQFFVDKPKGFFFKKNKNKVIEKTIVRPNYGNNGTISISETALVQMVSHCIEEYAEEIKLVKVSVYEIEEGYNIKLELSVNYKLGTTDTIKNLQNIIKNRIEKFTGIVIEKVDIEIVKITN